MSQGPNDSDWVSSIFLIPVRSPNGFQTWDALDPEWWRPFPKTRPRLRGRAGLPKRYVAGG